MDNRENQVLYTPTQKAAPAVADLGSFYQVYAQRISEGDVNSGANELFFSPTPAGIIRIVTTMQAYNLNSAISRILLGANVLSDEVYVKSVINLSAKEGVSFLGHVFLDEDNYMHALFYGCTAGDYIEASVIGYDIKKY